MRSYKAQWDSGIAETISARSIRREVEVAAWTPSDLAREVPDEEGDAGVDAADSSSDMSISDSSENAANSIITVDGGDSGLSRAENEDDGSVYAHGRRWIHCDAVLIDPADFVLARKASIHWPSHLLLGERSFVSYFYLMYPMGSLQTTIQETNTLLVERRQGVIGRGEFFRWIGSRLAMTLEPRRGPLTVYWNASVPERSVGTAANFGQLYGMTCRTFQNIQSALRFALSQAPADDPWQAVRLLINSFNEQRKRVISPGAVLCVDECMSSWQGREEKYTHDGIPHLTKIQRKPEGVGAELKSIGDGDTGILLGLDIMEGAQRQRQKAYNAEFGEGTAVVLRLAQPYAGSGRTVVADSAFASVKTLVQLNSMMGLYFMGMVKTATREYPMAYLKSWSSVSWPRGSHTVMESSCSNGSKMYALCWNDRKPKAIISNRGTTLPGSDSVRARHRRVVEGGEICTERYEKRIPRPYMVELFFRHFSTIDVHDHYRQGSLEMELNFNDYLTGRVRRDGNADCDMNDTSVPAHTLLVLGDRPQYQRLKKTPQRAQRRCKICKRKASFY
ncbi:Transposase IS4, partial [Phytophthora infestans]